MADKNLKKLLKLGISREQILSQPGVGKKINPKEYDILRSRFGQPSPVSTSTPSALPVLPPAISPVLPQSIPAINTSQLEALRGKYQETLAPKPEETEAETQLQNLITSKELGIAKIEQEPMAQAFATGQSAALEKATALRSLPLKTRLANLQNQRAAAADVLRSQLGFEEENVSRQTRERDLALETQRQNEEKALEASRYADKQNQLAQEQAYREKVFKIEQKASKKAEKVAKKSKKGQSNLELLKLQENARQFNIRESRLSKDKKTKITKNDIGDYIQEQSDQGKGWAEIEQGLRQAGVSTYTGSEADKILNKRFNPKQDKKKDKMQELLNALKQSE